MSTDLGIIAQSALLALLIVLLMPFPAQLFNSTVEENADEIRGWFAPLVRTLRGAGDAIGSFWRGPPGIVAFLALSTLIYAFLDPGFDLSAESVQTLIAIATGIVVITFLFAIPLVLAHRRRGGRPSLAVLPGTLIVGAVCVLISRIVDFQPGYLYGLVIGVAFATELDARSEGRSGAFAAVLMLIAAGVAWVGLGILSGSAPDGFLATLARTVLAAILVAGLEGVVFGLLPLRFLPGESVFRWNRAAWGALVGIGLFAFFHILINPASGYLSDSSRTPLFTALALFGAFAVVSIAFWGWFRFRAVPEPAADG